MPTIFDAFPEYLKENITPKRKLPTNPHDPHSNIPSDDESPLQTPMDNPNENESEVFSLKRKLQHAENQLECSKKKVKVLQQSKDA